MPWSIPTVWLGLPKEVAFEVEFDDTAEYEHPGGYDGWNKLFGVDATPLTAGNKGMSYIWAWRWNPNRAIGGIQLAAYINRPDGTFVAAQVLTIQKKQRVRLYIKFGETVLFSAFRPDGQPLFYTFPEKPPRTMLSRMIRAWFGGIYSAPHDINIFKKRLI